MVGTFAVRAVRTLLICSMLAVSSVVFAPPSPAEAAVSDDMMLLANQMRYAIGAPTLVPDSRIVAAAQNHANYSSANGQGGHFETAAAVLNWYSPLDRVAAWGCRPRRKRSLDGRLEWSCGFVTLDARPRSAYAPFASSMCWLLDTSGRTRRSATSRHFAIRSVYSCFRRARSDNPPLSGNEAPNLCRPARRDRCYRHVVTPVSTS